MGAYPAGDGRHGIGSQDDAGRLVHISFPQLFHIGGDVRMGRTPLCARSHAHLGCPKDGMVPVLPHHGGAEMSLFSGTVHPSAQAVRIPVVPAPHILTQVAAYGCGVSQVGDATLSAAWAIMGFFSFTRAERAMVFSVVIAPMSRLPCSSRI